MKLYKNELEDLRKIQVLSKELVDLLEKPKSQAALTDHIIGLKALLWRVAQRQKISSCSPQSESLFGEEFKEFSTEKDSFSIPIK